MKTVTKILSLVLVFALVSALLLPFVVRADEISAESETAFSVPDSLEDVSPADTDIPIEEAAPDYGVIVKIVIGVLIAGVVIYILVKPKKQY